MFAATRNRLWKLILLLLLLINNITDTTTRKMDEIVIRRKVFPFLFLLGEELVDTMIVTTIPYRGSYYFRCAIFVNIVVLFGLCMCRTCVCVVLSRILLILLRLL